MLRLMLQPQSTTNLPQFTTGLPLSTNQCQLCTSQLHITLRQWLLPTQHQSTTQPQLYTSQLHTIQPPVYKQPSYDEPAVYHYGYAVADDYSGVNFAANENRDGYATTGEYRVALPGGRTQIVTYNTADAYSGNVADVKYEGEAHYEPYHPAPVKAHQVAYHA